MTDNFDRQSQPHITHGGRFIANTRRKHHSKDIIQFEYEKFGKGSQSTNIPAWAEESKKVQALREGRKQQVSGLERRSGITELIHSKLESFDKIIEHHIEKHLMVESRPEGVVGFSADDVFVRSLPGAVSEENISECPFLEFYDDDGDHDEKNNNNNNEIEGNQEKLLTQKDNNSNNNSSKNTSLTKQEEADVQVVVPTQPEVTPKTNVELIETTEGLELAPISNQEKTKSTFICRLQLTAGTTAETAKEFLSTRCQHARHQSLRTKYENIVPCDLRFEGLGSGFSCAPVGSSMEVNCQVKTWNVGGAALAATIQLGWQPTKHGGRLRVVNVWSLDEYRKEFVHWEPSSASSSSSSDIENTKKSHHHHHPLVEYTCLVRGSESSLASILDQCKKVRDKGFVNYTSPFSFGVPSNRYSAPFSIALLNGRYTEAVLNHALCLAATSPGCISVVERLKDRLVLISEDRPDVTVSSDSSSSKISKSHRKNIAFEWKTAVSTLQAAIEEERHVCRLSKAKSVDFDIDPLNKLVELFQHISSIDGGDCEQALLDLSMIPNGVIQSHLKSLSDIHFNTLASVRVRKYGSLKVVPGDLVVVGNNNNNDDLSFLYELEQYSQSFVPPGICSGLDFHRRKKEIIAAQNFCENFALLSSSSSSSSLENENSKQEQKQEQEGILHLVRNEAEASNFNIFSVVLPKWGLFPSSSSSCVSSLLSEIFVQHPDKKQQQQQSYYSWEKKKAKKFIDFWNIPDSFSNSWNDKLFPFPAASGIDKESCDMISESLKMNFFEKKNNNNNNFETKHQNFLRKNIPFATYRPLMTKPHWFSAHCWDDRMNVDFPLSIHSNSRSSSTSKKSKNDSSLLSSSKLFSDGECYRRLNPPNLFAVSTSPLASKSNSNMDQQQKETKIITNRNTVNIDFILSDEYETDKKSNSKTSDSSRFSPSAITLPIRPSIRSSITRTNFLASSVAPPSSSITTALRFAVPAGVAMTSVLREIFKLRVMESKVVAKHLRKSVEESWKHQRGKLKRDEYKKKKDFSRKGKSVVF